MAGFWRTDAVRPRAAEVYGHTALRGLAALCVVGYHAALIAKAGAGGWGPVTGFLLSSFLFVDLFFMLSGFIMVEAYGASLRSALSGALGGGGGGLRPVLSYWRKRALKILPNYYIWLAVAIGFWSLRAAYFNNPQLQDPCFGPAIAAHLALVQSFTETCISFNTPLWSIVVELIAYLAFPLLVLALPAWPVLGLGGLALYAWVYLGQGTIDVLTDHPSVLRCLAGFSIGMALVPLSRALPRAVLVWGQGLAFLAVLVAVSWDAQPLALVCIACLVALTAQNLGPLVALLRWRVFYLLGRASFSIYLAHVPLLGLLNLVLSKLQSEIGVPLAGDWRLFVPICILICALAGLMAYMRIEHPLERLGRPRKT
ncbi:MAG: acyltransferase [Pseudomonadota bacterium]